MDSRWTRAHAASDEANGAPEQERAALLERWWPRLGPFLQGLVRREQQRHAARYIVGLMSALPNKSTETIAAFFGQPRHGLQHFLGASTWDWSPMTHELARQADEALREPGGVVSLSLCGFPKKGEASVGVQRQPLGGSSAAPVNCQVGVYLGYASRKGVAVTDVRLYLPRAWAGDRPRRRRCGVPPRLVYLSRPRLAMELLGSARAGPPPQRVVACAALGQFAELRTALRSAGWPYLVAIPPTMRVRPLNNGLTAPLLTAEQLGASLSGSVWSPTQSGPRSWEMATTGVVQGGRQSLPRESFLVIRRPEPEADRLDYYLSNISADLPAEEWRRLADAVPRTADYLRQAAENAGLASYELRTWVGWYHHQVLSLVAAWLLRREAPGEPVRDAPSQPAPLAYPAPFGDPQPP